MRRAPTSGSVSDIEGLGGPMYALPRMHRLGRIRSCSLLLGDADADLVKLSMARSPERNFPSLHTQKIPGRLIRMMVLWNNMKRSMTCTFEFASRIILAPFREG